MNNIQISPRFFIHELHNYSDWKSAFFRELIQNAIDADSSHISISINQITQTQCQIVFADNGIGMNEEVLRDVYFNLGATGKEGVDTIGGHGRARILTCFAHDNYQIRTQNLLCNGTGGTYEIETHHPHTRGCIVTITVHAANAAEMEDSLREYLSMCQLSCGVTINKAPFTTWLYRRITKRSLTIGTVHTTKAKPYHLIVRVRGVAMFHRSTACKLGAIVEIDPAQSREILTVSRDRFKTHNQSELDQFIEEITIDSSRFERESNLTKTDIYGSFRIVRRHDAAKQMEHSQPEPLTQTSSDVSGYTEQRLTTPPNIIPPTIPQASSRFVPTEYSLFYHNTPKAIVRAARRFEKGNLSGSRLKLLCAWDATCQFFVEHLQDLTKEEYFFLPGFVFASDMQGAHKLEYHHHIPGHLLYLNPLDSSGNLAVSHRDIETLYAIGLHEVAHISSSYHSETWGTIVTDLTRRTCSEIKTLRQRIAETVARITQLDS